jgi:hypothetical protein
MDDAALAAEAFEKRMGFVRKQHRRRAEPVVLPMSRKGICGRLLHDGRCAHLHRHQEPATCCNFCGSWTFCGATQRTTGAWSPMLSAKVAQKAQSKSKRARRRLKHELAAKSASAEEGKRHSACEA